MNPEEVIHQLLVKGTSQNQNDVQDAFNGLNKLEEENYPLYIFTLVNYFSSTNRDQGCRNLAGIMIKNLLFSDTPDSRSKLTERYKSMLPDDVKARIREMIYRTLSDQTPMRKVAAQIIAKIYFIDALTNSWVDLIQLLVDSVTQSNDHCLRQASLSSLGYICEEASPDTPGLSDKILTAVCFALRTEESNEDVKEAASNALLTAIEFCRNNFENPDERKYLMNVILSSAVSKTNKKVREYGLAILIQIATLYYQHLADYIIEIFKITIEYIKAGNEDNGKQAIEFWSSIADEEIALGSDNPKNNHFCNKALEEFVPVLLLSMTRQDNEEYDLEDYTLPMAASVCLNLFASCVKIQIVQYVLPFVEGNIRANEWNLKDSAILALSSILESPTQDILSIINAAIPILVDTIKAPNTVPVVKDTSAWTIGRIVKLHSQAIIQYIPVILATMLNCLINEPPRVAANACWTIHNLAMIDDSRNVTFVHFNDVLSTLLKTSERPDGNDFNLRVSSYEAMNIVIQNAPNHVLNFFEQILIIFLQRLEDSFNHPANQHLVELQESLNGVIQIISSRCPNLIEKHHQALMTQLIKLLRSPTGPQVAQEAFLTISMVVNIIEGNFANYMQDLAPSIYQALRNWQDSNACSAATGCVGDIARAIEIQILPFCDEIVKNLLDNLQNRNLDRMVKPTILTSFGDIAISIRENFTRYERYVLELLYHACETVCGAPVDLEDGDLIDYLNKFCNGIFEAFTGIIHGYTETKNFAPIDNMKLPILNLLVFISQNNFSDYQLQKSALGILGDLLGALPNLKQSCRQDPNIQNLLKICNDSDDDDIKSLASWVNDRLN